MVCVLACIQCFLFLAPVLIDEVGIAWPNHRAVYAMYQVHPCLVVRDRKKLASLMRHQHGHWSDTGCTGRRWVEFQVNVKTHSSTGKR